MSDSPKLSEMRALDRINLRLTSATFEAIDAARADRPGHVSRNTWITEAVSEKLERDQAHAPSPAGARQHRA